MEVGANVGGIDRRLVGGAVAGGVDAYILPVVVEDWNGAVGGAGVIVVDVELFDLPGGESFEIDIRVGSHVDRPGGCLCGRLMVIVPVFAVEIVGKNDFGLVASDPFGERAGRLQLARLDVRTIAENAVGPHVPCLVEGRCWVVLEARKDRLVAQAVGPGGIAELGFADFGSPAPVAARHRDAYGGELAHLRVVGIGPAKKDAFVVRVGADDH